MLSERQMQTIWYGGGRPPTWMRVLTKIYSAIVSVRRDMYASGLFPRKRVAVPVIIVGNITVGGTGKTPLVIALVRALRERGWNPGVITRGYTGKARDAFMLDAKTSPVVAGEEACLIRSSTGAPIAVGRDRAKAAATLLHATSADVLIADDGLQHYGLARDVEICVIDGERRFGNGLMLPAGPLREAVSRLPGFTYRVCNGGEPGVDEIPMTLSGDDALGLLDPPQCRPLRDFAGQRVHAVAGIGNPGRFFAKLRASNIDVIEHPFTDHFPFAARDLEFGDGLPVLMTEKDAVKCRHFAKAGQWCVPVQAQLPVGFLDDLAKQLCRHPHRPAAIAKGD